jgi:hypothetical protein
MDRPLIAVGGTNVDVDPTPGATSAAETELEVKVAIPATMETEMKSDEMRRMPSSVWVWGCGFGLFDYRTLF